MDLHDLASELLRRDLITFRQTPRIRRGLNVRLTNGDNYGASHLLRLANEDRLDEIETRESK